MTITRDNVIDALSGIGNGSAALDPEENAHNFVTQLEQETDLQLHNTGLFGRIRRELEKGESLEVRELLQYALQANRQGVTEGVSEQDRVDAQNETNAELAEEEGFNTRDLRAALSTVADENGMASIDDLMEAIEETYGDDLRGSELRRIRARFEEATNGNPFGRLNIGRAAFEAQDAANNP